MSNICVIGVGYVGLVTGACLAALGNGVVCLDMDDRKTDLLREGNLPIFEPGLQEMVRRNQHGGRLSFTTSYGEGLNGTEFVFIAVGTPSGSAGEADLTFIQQAAEGIAKRLSRPVTIINKSTVPIGTGDWVSDIVNEHQGAQVAFAVVSNPEACVRAPQCAIS